MRGVRSTLALIVILAGLGAYAYFVVSKQDDSGLPKQERVFAGVESDKIEEITIKSESGDKTTVKKENGAWQVVSPTSAKASDGDLTTVTSAIETVDIARVVDENPSDLKQYGLDPPQIDVEFKSSDNKPSGHLLIGEKSTAGGNLYAKRADQPRVFLIPSFHESSFNKSTFDLRDKTLIAFDRSTVDGIELVQDGKSMHLAKSGEDWKLTAPLTSRADNSAADGLVSQLEMAQVKSIVASDATEADLKKYGLDKPATLITLIMGSARASVAVGKREGDSVYVRDVSKPVVATMDQTFADDVKKGVEDYRRKDIFDFRAFNATHMEFTRGGKTIVFDRTKAPDGKGADIWKRAEPPADADKDTIEALLTGLADMRAESFVESSSNTGLASPVLTVVAKFDEGKQQERVSFGKTGSNAYADNADPGVARIDASRLDEALKNLDELSK